MPPSRGCSSPPLGSQACVSFVFSNVLSTVFFCFFSTVSQTSPSPSFSSARPYIVSWTGANADDRFEIDLHYGGSYSFGFEDVRHTNNYIV